MHNPSNIPALDIPLRDVHLIEASAGTGKTWTLAALAVRLLLERKRPCEQIIATTFTRAAAAEMRERIRGRINDTKRLIDDILLLPDVASDLSTHDVHALFNTIKTTLANNPRASELLADPLNDYIIQLLLTEEKRLLAGELATKKAGLLWARKHLELTLIQLDKLFVGTLDSLCQKLLREFAFDLLLQRGQGKPLNLTEGDDGAVTELTHDAIRIWRTQQHTKNPQLMTLFAETGKLTDVGDLNFAVSKALNFIAEPLAVTPEVSVDTDKMLSLTAQLSKASDTDLVSFLSPDGDYHAKFWKGRAFHKHGGAWRSLKQKLINHQAAVLPYLNAGEASLFAAFTDKLAGNFSSKNQDARTVFESLPIVTLVQKIADTLDGIKSQLDALREHQNYFVCDYVRTHLPSVLETQGKTTFSLQLRQLNDALIGEAGKTLAQQIRHRYPVALIDEFQDVNADQAGMIYKIYQHDLDDAQLRKGCLLLVGDPKQAIYGFRGGDIYNYQRIKKTIPTKNHHTLDTNRRSQTALIDSLNHVFGSREDLLENVAYKKVKAHGVDEVLLDAKGAPLADLLCHLSSENQSQDESEKNLATKSEADNTPDLPNLLAQKVSELLVTHRLKSADGNIRRLKPDDVAILFKSRWDVAGVEYQLNKRNIPTFMGTSTSVFAGSMAEDMAAIMKAMLTPQHLATVRRALASVAFGLTQAALNTLLDDESIVLSQSDGRDPSDIQPVDFADFQYAFSEAGKAWQRFGFLAAWQQLNDAFNLWLRLAAHEHGERYLVDVRHVLEIIQTQALENTAKPSQSGSQSMSGSATSANSNASEHALLTWYLRQMGEKPTDDWALERRLPSASGVQMMSIHKSKGLEFPIVFVVGVDKATKKAKKLNDIFLTIADDQIALTANAGKDDANLSYDNARRYAEDLRVTYVAFTRPSQLLYVVTQKSLEEAVIKKTKAGKKTGIHENALTHWLVDEADYRGDIANAFAPASADMTVDYHTNAHANADDERPADMGQADTSSEAHTVPNAPEKTYFQAWRATSFSALVRDLDAHTDTRTDTQAEHEPEYVIEELVNEQLLNNLASNDSEEVAQDVQLTAKLDIRFTFPRGANAGSFLHKVFEKLDFTDQKNWPWLIETIANQYGIAQEFERMGQVLDTDSISNITRWFTEILSTPLSSGVSLAAIPVKKRLPEMGFNLGLSGSHFSAGKLSELMQSADFPITLPPQTKLFRYLKGEIDLIYEQAGKYYVLDYKSNHLGDTLANYRQDQMRNAMSHAGYWLQAAIYTVALHRYLNIRLADYTPEQHLGGVEYAFIRGMHPDSIENGATTGVISWQPEVDFVLALDKVLGG